MQPEAAHIPRQPIGLRPWNQAQVLIHQHKISQQMISDVANVPLASVNRALSPRFCGRTNHTAVLRTRAAVENLLSRHGVAFDAAALWREYDNELLEDIE